MPSKRIYYLILLTFLFLVQFSCNEAQKVSTVINKSDIKLSDSLTNWISLSRNRQTDSAKRLNLLDKAEKQLPNFLNDSLRTRFASRISYTYFIFKDSLNFRRTNKLTRNLAQNTGDSVRLAEAYWDLGQFLHIKSVTDSAFYHYSKAQKIFEKLGKDFESARMLFNMGVTQAIVRDYTGSEINTIRAIELLKPLNKYKHLYYCYTSLGSVSKELREYDRSIDYYNTAAQYQEKIDAKNKFDVSLQNNLGVVFQAQGRYEESKTYFNRVLAEKGIQESNPKLYAYALSHLAYSELKTSPKNPKKISEKLETSIGILDSLDNPLGLARAHYNYSEYYLAQGDTLSAIAQAKLSSYFSELADNNDRKLQTLQLLAKLDPHKSADYNKQYIILNDSLQQEERQIRNKFARIRFETDEFIAENLLLARQKQLWTGIAVAVILLGLMSYFILDQRIKNQKLRFQQQQQANNQEIFNLMLAQNQKVEEGKKLEQKRISEELHDGVLGKMLGARMVLTGLNKRQGEEAETERKKAIDSLQEVEKEVRAISHELSHAAYQQINNFIYSIEDLLHTVQLTANFQYTFDYDKKFNWDGIKGNTKINVYRLIQESLQNCVKHSQCKNVSLNLSIDNDHLHILVSDDGKGFKTKRGKKGIGMRNMASRVEKLNGEWSIESSIGQGTTVSFNVPLQVENSKSNNDIRSAVEA